MGLETLVLDQPEIPNHLRPSIAHPIHNVVELKMREECGHKGGDSQTHPYSRHGAWLNGILSVSIVHADYLQSTS